MWQENESNDFLHVCVFNVWMLVDAHDEFKYHNESYMDIGHDKNNQESLDPKKSYSENKSQVCWLFPYGKK